MDAVATVRELFAAFARRDASGVAALVHPECHFWPQGTAEALGRTEPYSGPDGVEAYFADAERAWDALVLEATDVRAAGNGVICFGVAIGRLQGEAEERRVPVIWVFRIRDGLVAYGRAVATAAEARELVEPTAPGP